MVHAQAMTLGRSKMNVSRADLYRLILEEYAKEEGIELTEDKVDDLIAHIKGGPRPDWMDDDDREVPPPPEIPAAPEKEDSETFIMDAPVGGDMSDEEIVASISQMIQGRDPEHVSELFQAVFAQIPVWKWALPKRSQKLSILLAPKGAHRWDSNLKI